MPVPSSSTLQGEAGWVIGHEQFDRSRVAMSDRIADGFLCDSVKMNAAREIDLAYRAGLLKLAFDVEEILRLGRQIAERFGQIG